MATDDVTIVILANVAHASAHDRQPSAGVEEKLLDIGTYALEGSAPNQIQPIVVELIDGTNDDSIIQASDGAMQVTARFQGMHHIATNTNYFRFIQAVGGTGDASYAVIETG